MWLYKTKPLQFKESRDSTLKFHEKAWELATDQKQRQRLKKVKVNKLKRPGKSLSIVLYKKEERMDREER